MKSISFFVICLAFVITHAEKSQKDAVISSYDFERGKENDYSFRFDSSDGTSRQEQGGTDDNKALATSGTISWVAQDGSRYQMIFKADKYGFRPIIKRIAGP